ncbi:MAG: molecular chaperone TorD family protein [Eggerthellaceae bacterium]|nr:molecular chaperone TorD family protein [Eggerthellaceae bacterium]
MMEADTLELALANRAFLYALLARGYAEEPDEAYAHMFVSGHTRDEMGLVESGYTASIMSLYDALATRFAHPDAVKDIAEEYVRMFVGPYTLHANPWETVHLTGRRALFQPGVLDVRDAYRSAGFEPVRVRHVPDDFIGIEMDFLAKMAHRAWNQRHDADAAFRDTLEKSYAFARDHVITWIGSLSESVVETYENSFYGPFTQMANCVVRRDCELLGEVLLA